MLDNWAAWRRRGKYRYGPKPPKNAIAAVADLGIRQGPTRYVEEPKDTETEALIVDGFMSVLKTSSRRLYSALSARHAREYLDIDGLRIADRKLSERKIACILYGGEPQTARKAMQRDCDLGYALLAQHLRGLLCMSQCSI